MVEAGGLKPHFLFLGRRSDVPEILVSCDIAVLPSLAEGLPNAVLEYLAAGLPVIATALGGNLEAVLDGVTGLLIPPNDPEALVGGLRRLLQNPDSAATFAKAGQEHAQKEFSFERLVAEVDHLYSQLQSAARSTCFAAHSGITRPSQLMKSSRARAPAPHNLSRSTPAPNA